MSRYWVQGADGQTYGPAEPDEVRGWVADGRVDGQTQVQAEGSGEWRPLSAFAELADAGHPGEASEPVPTISTEDILARDYVVRFGDAFNLGWRVVMDNLGLFVGAFALQMAVSVAANMIPYVGFIAAMIVNPAVSGGFWWIAVKRMRGEPAEIADLFTGFKGEMLLNLALGSLLITVFTVVGLVFLIVPGVYLAVAFFFTLPLIIDRKMQFWDAMMLSLKMVNKHWWAIFGLAILCGLVALCGMLACCVGMLISIPVATCAAALVYNDMFTVRPAHEQADV